MAYLKLTRESSYPEDIQLLKLVAHFETRSRLRVKIVDATNDRYEVSVLETKMTEDLPKNHNRNDYEFLINSKTPGFRVVRRSSQEVKSKLFFFYPSI